MYWEVAASIAEVVSAIAVVVSLIYLASQIRAGTKVNQASAFQTAIDSEMHFAEILAHHAATWDKIVTGGTLDEGEETRRAIVLFNLYMLDVERRFHQFNAGYLEAQAWEGSRKALPRAVALPVFERWRPSLGATARGEDFLELLDDLAQKGFKE